MHPSRKSLGHGRKAVLGDVEKEIYEWIVNKRSRDLIVPAKLIQLQVPLLFSASNNSLRLTRR